MQKLSGFKILSVDDRKPTQKLDFKTIDNF